MSAYLPVVEPLHTRTLNGIGHMTHSHTHSEYDVVYLNAEGTASAHDRTTVATLAQADALWRAFAADDYYVACIIERHTTTLEGNRSDTVSLMIAARGCDRAISAWTGN